MQLAVNISLPNILTLISQMSLNEIEQIRNDLDKYLKKHNLEKKYKKPKAFLKKIHFTHL